MEKVVEFLISYWYILVAACCVGSYTTYTVMKFFNRPSEAIIADCKEWLKWAVSMAEKELGSGTGQLKLREVYNMFISVYPDLAYVIHFDTFSDWVDDALEWMDKQLESNVNFKEQLEN